jgi:hypothetical protein
MPPPADLLEDPVRPDKLALKAGGIAERRGLFDELAGLGRGVGGQDRFDFLSYGGVIAGGGVARRRVGPRSA